MGNEPPESGADTETIEHRFDTILGRHMQRLLGTRNGIEGLPITINAISCIILLAEQVKNEQGGLVQPEPYTREMLRDELVELCLDPDEVMETAIPAMIGRGYIQIHSDSGISIKEHTVRMARILDRIFPTMPGINLVAYLAQAMDEVKSERKSLETAEDHLDQTLTIHGVAFKKAAAEKNKASVPPKREQTLKREILASLTENRRPVRSKIIRGSDFDAARQKAATARQQHTVTKASPSSPLYTTHRETREKFDTPPSPEALKIHPTEDDKERHTVDAISETPKGGSEADNPTPAVSEVSPDTSPPKEEQISSEERPFDPPAGEERDLFPSESGVREEMSPSSPGDTPQEEDLNEEWKTPEEKHHLEPGDGIGYPPPGEGSSAERDDDIVEKRIAAFEEDLAMQCPLCGNAKIKSQETSTGKCYYSCSEKDCTFISWGKPYHLACPECGNPFLIESSARDGALILKCPRATCFHWQRHPWEAERGDTRGEALSFHASSESSTAPSPRKKKVVRKKVIRRKKR